MTGGDLSIGEVAQALGCSTWTVYRLVWRGKLAAYTVGRSLRVTRAELDRYREANERPPAKQGYVA